MGTDLQAIYALAIVAHPDDESFLFAGTTLKFADEGKKTAILCATKGEKGTDRMNRNLDQNQIASIRIRELHQACQILKCDCIEYFKYQDGALDQVPFSALVAELVQKIDEYYPRIILTFGPEGVTGHRDHIVIHKAVTEAVTKSKHKISEIWLASIPATSIDSFNKHLETRRVHLSHFQNQSLKGVTDEKLLKVDISKYKNLKHEALKAHESQYLPDFYQNIFQNYEYYEVIKIS